MTRPTSLQISSQALVHNLQQIKQRVGNTSIIAMVKANAYGCGIESVIPILKGRVSAWGVACLEEALAIRALDSETPCILFQGVFSPEEFPLLVEQQFHCVLHEAQQIHWLSVQDLKKKLPIWLKIDTGMHRLGFLPSALPSLLELLQSCSWVEKPLGLMTHLACADEPTRIENAEQMRIFSSLPVDIHAYKRSIANSAAILSFPDSHLDAVRPGIMLYGVSPFSQQTGQQLGLMPVMHFFSAISAIHMLPVHAQLGYGGTWRSERHSRIAIVAVGYGDGYPRHIQEGKVWIKNHLVPIVGRVSMDMLSIDITDFPDIQIGDEVELWGDHLPVEIVAKTAGTLAYELLSQISPRVRMQTYAKLH